MYSGLRGQSHSFLGVLQVCRRQHFMQWMAGGSAPICVGSLAKLVARSLLVGHAPATTDACVGRANQRHINQRGAQKIVCIQKA
jgi:hypothetical protein